MLNLCRLLQKEENKYMNAIVTMLFFFIICAALAMLFFGRFIIGIVSKNNKMLGQSFLTLINLFICITAIKYFYQGSSMVDIEKSLNFSIVRDTIAFVMCIGSCLLEMIESI